MELIITNWCFYSQDFVNAANCYEQLTIYHPEEDEYKVYYAQSLYQACLYEEAMKVTVQIEASHMSSKLMKLQAAIKYGEEDLAGAKSLVDQVCCTLLKASWSVVNCHIFRSVQVTTQTRRSTEDVCSTRRDAMKRPWPNSPVLSRYLLHEIACCN